MPDHPTRKTRQIIEAWIDDVDALRRWNPQAIDSLVEKLAPPTCSTCRHWTTDVCVSFTHEMRLCDHARFSATTPDGIVAKGVVQIATGPDFGCLHHEPKEAT